MKGSPGPRKTVKLSAPLHKPLNMYTLSATVAGVGLLAPARPAEAEIVYTPTHVIIRPNHYFNLDLNHDGIIDFVIKNTYGAFNSVDGRVSAIPPLCSDKTTPPWSNHCPNALEGPLFSREPTAYALPPGAVIGPALGFRHSGGFKGRVMTSQCGCGFGPYGQWANVTDRYLGVRFLDANGATHYGWARMSVKEISFAKFVALLTGYAYETVPNEPIIAGQTKRITDGSTSEPDSVTPDDPGPGASLINPSSEMPQITSLGMLAVGAESIPLWRRKEGVDASSPTKL
jgi:hypothetical protein